MVLLGELSGGPGSDPEVHDPCCYGSCTLRLSGVPPCIYIYMYKYVHVYITMCMHIYLIFSNFYVVGNFDEVYSLLQTCFEKRCE